MVVSLDDNIVAIMGNDVIPFVGMILAKQPELTLAGSAMRDPAPAIRQHVSFSRKAYKITCLATKQRCTLIKAKTFDML
jgi:hypothetical protein